MSEIAAGNTGFLSIEQEAQMCLDIGQPYDTWIRLAILMGLRQSAQFWLRWADIDLDRGLSTLPDTKPRSVHYVHMMEEAKALLTSLIPGNTSVWGVVEREPRDAHGSSQLLCSDVLAANHDREALQHDLAHLASYVRLTARHERPGSLAHHCGSISTQWNRLGARYAISPLLACKWRFRGVRG